MLAPDSPGFVSSKIRAKRNNHRKLAVEPPIWTYDRQIGSSPQITGENKKKKS